MSRDTNAGHAGCGRTADKVVVAKEVAAEVPCQNLQEFEGAP